MMKNLNKKIYLDSENEELMDIISEIDERDELLCTGYVCGTDATFI